MSKKLLSVALVFACALTLVACNKQEEKAVDTTMNGEAKVEGTTEDTTTTEGSTTVDAKIEAEVK